jgi:hypothetical protein
LVNNQALVINTATATGLAWATMTAAMVTNAVDSTATYNNPAWLNQLAWTKITGVPAGVVSPLNARGDIHVFATPGGDVRLPAGADGLVLTTDSTQATGLIWKTAGTTSPTACCGTR